MADKPIIQFKRTNVPTAVPNTTDPSNSQYIVAGEFALNMADGVLYTSNGSADGLIAVGARQKTFQTTTVTVSESFEIGDISTQLLKANSTTIFAGNTSTNLTVSTTTLSVQNTSTNSTVTPNQIFVGNSTVNAQFNLVGGNADLEIDSFSYNTTTAKATFGTSTPHNLRYPPKGTYVTLSDMTGPASPFSGTYEVDTIVSTTSFTIANVTFGGVVATNSTSVSRTNGVSRLLTKANHGFGNGSQIMVTGVGPDLKDPLLSFDGTFTVVDTIAASTTIKYNQHPIVSTTPNYMYKLAGDNFVTYKTSSPHNLSSNYLISTNAYPSGISTPIRTQASVNAVAFATLYDSWYDKSTGAVAGKTGVGGSVYMLVDSSDANYKIFNSSQSVPVTLETDGGSYQDIYTRSISSAFYDPTTLSKTGAIQYITITLSEQLFALGGGVILSGFTGPWAFLNDKQLPISQITTTNYGKILSNGSYASAPTYDRYKCYTIDVRGIANVSTIPNKSTLPFYNTSGANLTVRVPVNMAAISNVSKATQMKAPAASGVYLIRVDNTAAAADVTNNTSDITWSRDGAYKYGLSTGANMPYTSTGWNGYGQATGAAKTLTITFGVNVSSFSADQWCLLMGNFARDWVRSAGNSFANISGTNLGLYKIISVNNTAKTITFDWTNGQIPYIGSWGSPGGWRDYYYISDKTWNNVIVQPFIVTSSKVKITANMDRAVSTPQAVNIINSTAFTMQLNSLENADTTYGSYAAPLPVVSGSFTRNTDVGPGKFITRPTGPKTPPAYVTYDSTGVVGGTCHIEYSSYVEVSNSTAGVRITPTTFYNGNSSSNLFSNSSLMSISSPSNALKLETGGFSIIGTNAGVYDPSKPVMAVNSSIIKIGTGLKGITIDGAGKIKQYGSELDIGTELANVFINEYSITINANDQRTVINATSSIFPGNVAIGGSLYVGDSYGDIGQVLSTDGTNLLWVDNGIDFGVDHTFGANLTVTNTLLPGSIDIVDEVGNEVQIKSDATYYTSNTLEQLVITANSIEFSSNDTYSNTTTIKSTSIKIGNATVNSTVNSTSFTGTANNTLYVGSVKADNVVSNAQLSSNLSNYQTLAGLSANVAKLTANAANYLEGNTASDLRTYSETKAGTAYSNAIAYSGNAVLAYTNAAAYADVKSGEAYTNAVTYSGNAALAYANAVAKIAISTANNSLYLGGYAADQYAFANTVVSVNINSTYSWTNVHTFNNTVIITKGLTANGSNGTAGQVLMTPGTGGNVYWATVGTGGIGSVTSVASGDGLTGGPVTSTGTLSVLANTGIIANSTGVFLDTTYTSNADNITSGTLNTARLPATVNVTTLLNVGSSINVNTTSINVGSVAIKANSIVIPANASIDFDVTTYKPTFQKGRMYWDNEEQTIVVYGDGSSFEQTMGQREWVRCRNSTASTIPKGTPVYITGVHIPGNPVHGHHPTVAPGDASDYNKSQIVGLAGEDIIAGAHGYVVVRGYIEGINTSALTSGQRAHLGFATPGTIVLSAPEYPNYPTDLGMCLTSDATNGTFYVDLAMNTAERFRTTQDMYVGGNLTVSGDFSVTGNIVSTSATNLSVSDNLIYVGQGDTISPAATTFTGSGLNDMVFHGVFEGTSSVHYYVKIDSVGGTDTFAWSKNNFATTIASGISITGNRQSLDNGITVQFNATTGHTLNNKWDGTGAPVNVDLGWVGNYNDGIYQHSGLFRDATDGVYKFFQGYTPEPDAAVNIDTGHASFQFASIQANVVTANLVGTANNANNLGGFAAAGYIQNTNSRTLSGNLYFTGANSYFGGKVTLNSNLVINTGLDIIDSTGARGTAGQVLTSNGTGNVYWSTVTSGGTGSVTSVVSGDGLTGGPITSTGTLSVLANTGIVSNSFGVFVDTTTIATRSYVTGLGYLTSISGIGNTAYDSSRLGGALASSYLTSISGIGNTAYDSSKLGGALAAGFVQNTESRTLSGNLYFTGTNNYISSNLYFANASAIQIGTYGATNVIGAIFSNNGIQIGNSTISIIANTTALTINDTSVTTGNVTIAIANISIGNSTVKSSINSTSFSGTANNALNLGGVVAASYQLNSTLNANIASYLPTYTGVVNASSHTTGGGYGSVTGGAVVNSTIIAVGNSTVNATINSTSFSGTSANATNLGSVAAANYVQNTDSRTLSGNLNFTAVNTYFSGKATHAANLVLNAGISIIDSTGGQGTVGQVLTSNGTGNVYWSTVSAGVSWPGGVMANTVQFTNTTASLNAISGAVTITGGLGVSNNIYTAGRVGFSNSTNISTVYTYYNAATDSLDTVFG